MSDPSRPVRTAAVIPAAGRGVRLGPGTPKALRTLGGTPMLVHAVRAMAGSRAVSLVVVVAPPDGAAEVSRLLHEHPLAETHRGRGRPRRRDPPGVGQLGLAALPDTIDACWCMTPRARWSRWTPWTRWSPPYAPVRPPSSRRCRSPTPSSRSTRTAPQGGPEPVVGTPERALLRAVQTPQGFDLATLRKRA